MILTSIFTLLFFSFFLILLISNTFFIKQISLTVSGLVFFLSCLLLIQFDFNSFYFQHTVKYTVGSDILNLVFYFGFDGISIFFFWLSSLLMFCCILFVFDEKKLIKEYLLTLLAIEFFLLVVFSILDLFIFYIFFESILIPMYLLIGIWGSRERKVRAVYLLFFYTLFGSLLMLIGILYIYSQVGSLSFENILSHTFTFKEQLWLWSSFFLSFASKIPMFPFHIWLPEAHVEAPTVGSVLLAGILLKLGVYGFLRFSLTLFPEASVFFSPLIYLLSIIGIIFASLCAIRQTDLKRIIAYSSIAHMNLVTLGIFSFNIIGIEGAIIQSISHGFVSGAMFLLVGVLYDRYHSRLLYYYGGLVHTMPVYAIFLLFFTMANIALPGTSSFVGEFMLLTGLFKTSAFTTIIATTGVILCGAYSLWLYNKIIFGNLKIYYTHKYNDMNLKEFVILFPLMLLVLLLGVYPTFFLQYFHLSVYNLPIE